MFLGDLAPYRAARAIRFNVIQRWNQGLQIRVAHLARKVLIRASTHREVGTVSRR